MEWLQLPLETRSHMFRQYITVTKSFNNMLHHYSMHAAAADRTARIFMTTYSKQHCGIVLVLS